MKIYFLAEAEEDLRELRRYLIRGFGESSWNDSYRKIKTAIRNLQTAPESGSIPEELTDLPLGRYCQLMSGKNRILYEIRNDALYIHVVCDGRRDMRTLLSHRLMRSPR